MNRKSLWGITSTLEGDTVSRNNHFFKDTMNKIAHRQHFFDNCLPHPKVKDCISGKNEERVLDFLEYIGYELDKDFVRQHPIGNSFVIDFAFVNEQLALEVDGKTHKAEKQRSNDVVRDWFFYSHNWVVIRVLEDKFFSDGGTAFYKYLIKDIVRIRRDQYDTGKLYEIDIPEFKDDV